MRRSRHHPGFAPCTPLWPGVVVKWRSAQRGIRTCPYVPSPTCSSFSKASTERAPCSSNIMSDPLLLRRKPLSRLATVSKPRHSWIYASFPILSPYGYLTAWSCKILPSVPSYLHFEGTNIPSISIKLKVRTALFYSLFLGPGTARHATGCVQGVADEPLRGCLTLNPEKPTPTP